MTALRISRHSSLMRAGSPRHLIALASVDGCLRRHLPPLLQVCALRGRRTPCLLCRQPLSPTLHACDGRPEQSHHPACRSTVRQRACHCRRPPPHPPCALCVGTRARWRPYVPPARPAARVRRRADGGQEAQQVLPPPARRHPAGGGCGAGPRSRGLCAAGCGRRAAPAAGVGRTAVLVPSGADQGVHGQAVGGGLGEPATARAVHRVPCTLRAAHQQPNPVAEPIQHALSGALQPCPAPLLPHWRPSYRAAVQTLLCAARRERSAQTTPLAHSKQGFGGCGRAESTALQAQPASDIHGAGAPVAALLGSLPHEVLLRIAVLAAVPLSIWPA